MSVGKAGFGEISDILNELVVVKRFAQHAATGEVRCEDRIGGGRQVEQMDLTGDRLEIVWPVGDQDIHLFTAGLNEFDRSGGVETHHAETTADQHVLQELADKWVLDYRD